MRRTDGLWAAVAMCGLALGGCGDGDDCDPFCEEEVEDQDEGPPNAVVVPCGIDFGVVEIGSVESRAMKVSNTGVGTLNIVSSSVESPFSVGGGAAVVVEAGLSYQFTVRYQPVTWGTHEGTLVVRTDDPDEGRIECPLVGRVEADLDGDGYASVESGGTDCDDDDPTIYPGAPNTWYDGIDQGCTGLSDYDQDGDGYDSEVFNPDCETGGGDCVDVDPLIHPCHDGDIWYDGIDSNCDGVNDYDQDGDGWLSSDYGGQDCDDGDADVSPEGTEVFNGVDDDCDGVVDDDAAADDAHAIVTGDSTAGNERAGYSLAVGDFDDDGLADVAIGVPYFSYAGATGTEGAAQGAVALFMSEGWADGDETDADSDWQIEGEDSTGEFGTSLANLGDWDDDGVDDLAVGAAMLDSKDGRVYLFSGEDVNGADPTDALVSIDGLDDARLGLAMAEHTDLDGDGVFDLVAFGVASHAKLRNYLLVHYGGGDEGALDWSDADSTWRVACGTQTSGVVSCHGPDPTATPGGTPEWARNAHTGADIDGDGYHDLILGDRLNDDAAAQAGRAWVLWGSGTEYTAYNGGLNGMATTLAQGTAVKDYIGQYVHASADADGDGDAEIWISDGGSDLLYFMEGGIAVRDGNFDLTADADADFDIGGWDDVTQFASTGDWTGDGVDDFAVSFGGAGGSSGGLVVLYESQIWSGSHVATAVTSGSLLGATDLDGDGIDDGAYFGLGLPRTMADLDSDSTTDLLVGDYGLFDEQGGVFFFYNDH